MDSGSYIWKISRIMEISHVNVCLTLTSTFRILRSVSVSMARNFWPVVASCQRTYLCLPHSKHRYCVCCVDFWIKHWYCIELVNKRFPLYYIYCAEEMNLINVSADIHHSVSWGNTDSFKGTRKRITFTTLNRMDSSIGWRRVIGQFYHVRNSRRFQAALALSPLQSSQSSAPYNQQHVKLFAVVKKSIFPPTTPQLLKSGCACGSSLIVGRFCVSFEQN